MALNPVAYTENVVRNFLRYQLTAYAFADPEPSPLVRGPYIHPVASVRDGASVSSLVYERLLHPHLADRITKTSRTSAATKTRRSAPPSRR